MQDSYDQPPQRRNDEVEGGGCWPDDKGTNKSVTAVAVGRSEACKC